MISDLMFVQFVSESGELQEGITYLWETLPTFFVQPAEFNFVPAFRLSPQSIVFCPYEQDRNKKGNLKKLRRAFQNYNIWEQFHK